MLEVLGTAATNGIPFGGGSGRHLIVNHATGSNVTIDQLEPKPALAAYTLETGWSTNTAITAAEAQAGDDFDADAGQQYIEIPSFTTQTGTANTRYVFAVPATHQINEIWRNGQRRLSMFTRVGTTITIGTIVYRAWYHTNAIPRNSWSGDYLVVEVGMADVWLDDVTNSVLGAASISADGTYSLSLARNGIYRAAVGTAGSQAWIA